MLNQNQVIDTIKTLPIEFDMDELFEKIIILNKLKKAEQSITEVKFVSNSDALKIFQQWSK
jgi:hypothetical protein